MSVSQQTWEEAVLWLRNQPEHQELVRDCFFDDPLIEAAERYRASSEWSDVQALVGADGGTVLDVGAGRGTSSYAFARDGWSVTALEPDPSDIVGAGAIRHLFADAALPVDIVEAWGESLPFNDAAFDLVYGRQVLHHARDLGALCKEMSRVLRPGGMFLATREHVLASESDLPSFLAKHPLHHLYGGEHAYTLDQYSSAMRNAGIRITQVMNPWASAINYFPRTTEQLAELIHHRLPFAPAALFTPAVLRRLGRFQRSPGASYSFVGVRDA